MSSSPSSSARRCCAAHYASGTEARSAAASFRQAVQRAQAHQQELRDRLSEMASQMNELQRKGADVGKIDQRIAKIGNETWCLNLEKGEALAEMREGFFCTGCGRDALRHLEERCSARGFPPPGPTDPGGDPRRVGQEVEGVRRQDQRAEVGTRYASSGAGQKVKQFEAVLARQQRDGDGVRSQLLQAGAEENNARLQMNSANAAASTLEHAERWKAESQQRQELELVLAGRLDEARSVLEKLVASTDPRVVRESAEQLKTLQTFQRQEAVVRETEASAARFAPGGGPAGVGRGKAGKARCPRRRQPGARTAKAL